MSFCPKYARVGCSRSVSKSIPRARVWVRTRTRTYLDDVEELEDDRRDAPEEGGARLTFHLVRVPLDLDECALLFRDALRNPARVHFLYGRDEHGGGGAWAQRSIDGYRGKQLQIAREGARVRREVFMRRELRGVDEYRHYCQVVFRERTAYCLAHAAFRWHLLDMVTIVSYSPRDKCPSCNAPIVGTNPTLFFSSYALLLHSLFEAMVGKRGMLDGGSSVDMFRRRGRGVSPGRRAVDPRRRMQVSDRIRRCRRGTRGEQDGLEVRPMKTPWWMSVGQVFSCSSDPSQITSKFDTRDIS